MKPHSRDILGKKMAFVMKNIWDFFRFIYHFRGIEWIDGRKCKQLANNDRVINKTNSLEFQWGDGRPWACWHQKTANHDWLLVSAPLKNIKVSWGDEIPN
jgi:hypothetical protein